MVADAVPLVVAETIVVAVMQFMVVVLVMVAVQCMSAVPVVVADAPNGRWYARRSMVRLAVVWYARRSYGVKGRQDAMPSTRKRLHLGCC